MQGDQSFAGRSGKHGTKGYETDLRKSKKKERGESYDKSFGIAKGLVGASPPRSRGSVVSRLASDVRRASSMRDDGSELCLFSVSRRRYAGADERHHPTQ
jgi:hypothetical protein